MQYYMPTRLITGKDVVVENAELIGSYGKKTLIVTGANSAKKCGALDDVVKALESQQVEYKVYDGICQNPTMASCEEAADIAKKFGAEFIIGIGGGSPLDAAKVVAKKAADKTLPIVLVGTTAGTGSEVTKVAVITNDEGFKKSQKSDDMYAQVAFGDPKYTMTLSREFTASTAIDALAHCVESYFSKKANEISRGTALQGIAILLKELPKIAAGEELSYETRENLYDASILGGLSIAVTGTIFCHNVGYYFTEHFKLPHGVACAITMPALMKHVMKADPEYTQDFYKRLGTDEKAFVSLVEAVLPEVDCLMTEAMIDELLPRWENNASVMSTIGTVTTQYIKVILMEMFVK